MAVIFAATIVYLGLRFRIYTANHVLAVVAGTGRTKRSGVLDVRVIFDAF